MSNDNPARDSPTGRFATTGRIETVTNLPATEVSLESQMESACGEAFSFEEDDTAILMWANAESDLGLFIRSDGAGGMKYRVGYDDVDANELPATYAPLTCGLLAAEMFDLDEQPGSIQARVDAALPILWEYALRKFHGR